MCLAGESGSVSFSSFFLGIVQVGFSKVDHDFPFGSFSLFLFSSFLFCSECRLLLSSPVASSENHKEEEEEEEGTMNSGGQTERDLTQVKNCCSHGNVSIIYKVLYVGKKKLAQAFKVIFKRCWMSSERVFLPHILLFPQPLWLDRTEQRARLKKFYPSPPPPPLSFFFPLPSQSIFEWHVELAVSNSITFLCLLLLLLLKTWLAVRLFLDLEKEEERSNETTIPHHVHKKVKHGCFFLSFFPLYFCGGSDHRTIWI